MSGALTFRFISQTQIDVHRITRQLADVQGQIASGAVARDLQGFGSASSRLLNAQGLKASADAKQSVINQLQARFGLQETALGRVADGAQLLAQSIREAIAANDGRGIALELDLSFTSIVLALNESWNGQPLFAGERQGAGPIKISTLGELLAAVTPDDIFDEALRHQEIDFGVGAPIVLSAKASELSQGLFDAMRDLKLLLDAAGGSIGQPISGPQSTALQQIAARLTDEAARFTNEQGRAGQLQKRFSNEAVRLEEYSNLLVKEIGSQADADMAEVSIRLSSLMAQYEAAAMTFSQLSKLSLLDYL
jgi:flagellar hook-associated protein 3 FlgL